MNEYEKAEEHPSSGVARLAAELGREKQRTVRATAELAAFKEAMLMILGVQGKTSIEMVERVAAGLLSRGGF